MASNDFIQAISEHVMGNCSEFTALRNRFKDFDACTGQPAAAALGYLIAKGELEAKKEEEEEELDVYDEAVEVIKKYCHPPGNNSAHTATDEIFTLIYEWLDEGLMAKGWGRGGVIHKDLGELFQPFIIKKSE
jgi:hypothetical protein